MPTRMTVNGRVLMQSRDFTSPSWDKGLPTDKSGYVLNTFPVAADKRPAPFPYEPGEPYLDPEDGLTYAVLREAPMAHGWATAEFWCTRWKIGYPELVTLCSKGLLEACIVYGSPVRRFRCPDERPVRQGKMLEQMQGTNRTRLKKHR